MPLKSSTKRKIYNHIYYQNHREAAALNRDRWRKNNPEKQRLSAYRHNLKKRFGLSPEEYVILLENQVGVCRICRKPQQGKNLAVDHNHATNKIRGLLCSHCNQGIGHFYDSSELLISASNYLKETL